MGLMLLIFFSFSDVSIIRNIIFLAILGIIFRTISYLALRLLYKGNASEIMILWYRRQLKVQVNAIGAKVELNTKMPTLKLSGDLKTSGDNLLLTPKLVPEYKVSERFIRRSSDHSVSYADLIANKPETPISLTPDIKPIIREVTEIELGGETNRSFAKDESPRNTEKSVAPDSINLQQYESFKKQLPIEEDQLENNPPISLSDIKSITEFITSNNDADTQSLSMKITNLKLTADNNFHRLSNLDDTLDIEAAQRVLEDYNK